MSKELDAFTRIMETYGKTNSLEGTYNDFLTIKKALHRLETLDNSNPNEALEVLDKTISPLLEPILAEYEDDLSDKITANYFALKQALIKVQEQEEENSTFVGGRTFNKDILYLKQSIEQCNDKPIFYVSRIYGNKYIIPQKQFDDLTNENIRYKRVLEIIKEKCVSMWHLMKSKTFEEYNWYLNIEGVEDTKIFTLTEEEFNLLKETICNE